MTTQVSKDLLLASWSLHLTPWHCLPWFNYVAMIILHWGCLALCDRFIFWVMEVYKSWPASPSKENYFAEVFLIFTMLLNPFSRIHLPIAIDQWMASGYHWEWVSMQEVLTTLLMNFWVDLPLETLLLMNYWAYVWNYSLSWWTDCTPSLQSFFSQQKGSFPCDRLSARVFPSVFFWTTQTYFLYSKYITIIITNFIHSFNCSKRAVPCNTQ